jgi:hypothetical protein
MGYQINNLSSTNTYFLPDELPSLSHINKISNDGSFQQVLYLKLGDIDVIDGFREWEKDLYLTSLCLSLEKKGRGTLTVNLKKASNATLSDATTVASLVYNLGTTGWDDRYYNRVSFSPAIKLDVGYIHYVSITTTDNKSYNLFLQGNFYYGN